MAATHAYFSQFNPNPDATFLSYELGPDGEPLKPKPKRVRRQPVKAPPDVRTFPPTPYPLPPTPSLRTPRALTKA
jgi:hypothetical protein